MQDVSDDKPRMSAEEADAKFAALVATYRTEKKPRRERGSLPTLHPAFTVLIAYVLGVALGAHWHGAISKALLSGLLVAFVVWGWRALSGKRDQ